MQSKTKGRKRNCDHTMDWGRRHALNYGTREGQRVSEDAAGILKEGLGHHCMVGLEVGRMQRRISLGVVGLAPIMQSGRTGNGTNGARTMQQSDLGVGLEMTQ